jgi:hypothetical protein
MEGLRAKAKENFLQGQKFLEPPDPIQPWQASLFMTSVVTICKRSSHVAFLQANIPRTELLENLKAPLDPHNEEKPTAIFRLVKIDRGLEDGRIPLAKNLFMDIFKEFGLDEYWLHLVQYWAYGFYQIQHRNPGHGPQHSCYLNMVSFTLIWSFNAQTSTTKAIFIPRRMDGLINPGGIYGRFTSLLEAQKSLIDDSSFCSFLCACYLVHWIDIYIGVELPKIRKIEGATGYSQWIDENHDDDPGTESLAEMSKKTGESLSSLANVARHVALAKTLLQKLKTGEGQVSTVASGEDDNAGSMSSADQIREALTILQSQIEFSDHYTTYLQERARTQQPVVCSPLPPPFSLTAATNTPRFSTSSEAKTQEPILKSLNQPRTTAQP